LAARFFLSSAFFDSASSDWPDPSTCAPVNCVVVGDMKGDCGVGDIGRDRRPNGAENFLNIENGDADPSTAFFHSKGSKSKTLLISVVFGRCRGLLCQQRFRSG
jgi:hypothetical protein